MYLTRREFLKLSGTAFALSLSLPKNLFASGITIPVLLYHDISDGYRDEYTISPSNFASQMEWLYSDGYKALSLREILNVKDAQRRFILTFDDGYRSFVDYAFPLLMEYNFKATINIIGQYVGTFFIVGNGNRPMLSWDEYRHLIESGLVDLGCHTYNLHEFSHRGVLGVSEEEIIKDLSLFQETFKKEIGIHAEILAWPFGLYDKESIEIARNAGFKYILTSNEGYFDRNGSRYAIPRLNINDKLDLLSFQEYIGGKI